MRTRQIRQPRESRAYLNRQKREMMEISLPPVPGNDGTEDRARALFDAQPHRHPGGQTPDWNVQPDHLKEVFRRFIREGRRPER